MFAVDHAATALLVKRRYPSVPIPALLISVQAMELAWVAFNFLGVERTTTEATVESVADIHLAYMPYCTRSRRRSAVRCWRGSSSPAHSAGRSPDAPSASGSCRISSSISSRTHLTSRSHPLPDRRCLVWDSTSGLRWSASRWNWPTASSAGTVFRGGRALFWVVFLGNLANLSFFSSAIPGPERYLAGHPELVVTVVFIRSLQRSCLSAFWPIRAGDRRDPLTWQIAGPGSVDARREEAVYTDAVTRRAGHERGSP